MTRSALTFACMLALTGATAAAPAQQLLDRVLARVGDSAITMTDLDAATGFGVVAPGSGARDPLQQLIDRRLVLLEMMRRPPVPPDSAAVDAELARLRAIAGDRWSVLMASTGVDQDRLRRIARDNLRVTAYLAERFPLVPAGDADAEQYYRSRPDVFTRDGTVLPFDDVVDEARRGAAEERRDTRIAGWLTTLRNRTGVVVLP
jgi:hypothetical protein